MSARVYELIYIMVPDSTEQAVADMQAQVEGIVQRLGGSIQTTDVWGRRKLAYDIGKHKDGFYVLHVIAGSGELMKELDRRLKVTEGLIRHLIVRVDERQRVADRARTKRQTESARRRVARGLPPERQPGEGPQGDNDDDADVSYDGVDGEV
jgi:small subunit ribosomal protein S6